MWRPQPKKALTDHEEVTDEPVELSVWGQISNILNPPSLALLVALPFAMITPLKNMLFLDSDAIFHDNVYAAIWRIGSLTSVMILLALGSTLSRGYPPNCDISR